MIKQGNALVAGAENYLGVNISDTPLADNISPKFNPLSDEFTDQERLKRRARALAATQNLFSTDISKLDDAAAAGLYQASVKGIFDIEDSDGSVAFGKRAAKNPHDNIELLRRFCKGEYSLIQDDEYKKWNEMDEMQKFQYALEHESTRNKIKSYTEGERGAGLWENLTAGFAYSGVGLPPGAMTTARMTTGNKKLEKDAQALLAESARRSNYDTLTPEEQSAYRADVINDYDKKLSKRQALATFLAMRDGLSDRASMLLAKAYNTGEVDMNAMEALSPLDRDRAYTALSIMRGDQKKGHLLGIPTDFDDDTAFNRFQLGLYGFQQSVLGLFTGAWDMGKSAVKWSYAYAGLNDAERNRYIKRWDAEVRAERALQQALPNADGVVGEGFQALMENLHWFIPFGMIGKGGKLIRAAQGVTEDAKWYKKFAATFTPLRFGRNAKDKAFLAEGALNLAKAEHASTLKDLQLLDKISGGGWTKGNVLLARQLATIERYTQELADAQKAVKAAKTAGWIGEGAYWSGEAMAFSSFANEYIATCDAAGISRADSVPMAAIIGWLNAKIENIYVPGLESGLTKAEVKHLTFSAFVQAVKTDGMAGAREWISNRVRYGLKEGIKVTLEEGAIEEPLQQIVIEHGKAIAATSQKLRENDQADFADQLNAYWDSIKDTAAYDLKTFMDTAIDMVPTSIGFGLTTIGNQTRRQHLQNAILRHENRAKYQRTVADAKAKGLPIPVMPTMFERGNNGMLLFNPDAVDIDVGVADIVAKAVNVRKLMNQHWRTEGADKTRSFANDPNGLTKAITAARKVWEAGEGDVVRGISDAAQVDIHTAEVLFDYFAAESHARLSSPNVKAFIEHDLSTVDLSDETMQKVLPGYVKGSFVHDPEQGLYSGQIKLSNGKVKTIAYVYGDVSEKLMALADEQSKIDSQLGKSYDARIDAGTTGGKRWRELDESERYNLALKNSNALSSGRSGCFTVADDNGKEIIINADDIIYLSNGELGKIGYGAMATQGTVRHETWHSLWRFLSAELSAEDKQQLAKTLGVDTTKKDWEVALDEAMSYQFEQYASGNYVNHSVDGVVARFIDSTSGKMIRQLSKLGLTDEIKNPKTGKAYALQDFYDAVLRGEIGSGKIGYIQTEIPDVAPDKKSTTEQSADIPLKVSPEEVEKADSEVAQTAEKTEPEAPPAPAATKDDYTLDNPAEAQVPNARFYRVSAGDGVTIVGELVVSDASQLKTSYKGNLSDPQLQNRGETQEGRALVEKIAGNPLPLEVGTVQPRANNGFIWTTPSLDVFIGNTRSTGITLAYDRGNGAALDEHMRQEAQKRGIEIPEGIKHPVVHFVLRKIESEGGKANIYDVVRMTNESVNRGMNKYEQAKNDADVVLKNNLASGIILNAEGNIDTAKSATAIGTFRQLTNAQGLIDENTDLLSEEGQARLKNAVIATSLNGANPNLLARIISQAKHLDIENELNAIMRGSSEMMKLAIVKPQYDLQQPLAEALDYYVDWRDRDEKLRAEAGKDRRTWSEKTANGNRKHGISWQQYMSQGDMFRTPSPEARIIGDLLAAARELRSFDKEDNESSAGKIRAQKFIDDYLNDYIANAYAANTETVDMFGTPPPTRLDIMNYQRNKDGATRFSIVNISPSDADTDPAAKAYLDALKRPDANERTTLLAPNGKRSNLTNALYHLVRTKRFKKWFGDWEKKAILDKAVEFALNGKPVASITGNEFAQNGQHDLIDRISAFFSSIGGKVKNQELGDVILDRDSARSSLGHGIGREKAAAFAAVPDVIRNGFIFDRQENWKGRGVSSFALVAPIKMGNDIYVCEAIVEQKGKGKERRFYLHEVNLQSSLSDTIKTPTGGASIGKPSRPVRSILAKLVSDFNHKSVSKVVDENGEPLPVYHGSNSQHNTYNQYESFHAADKSVAESYAKRGEKVVQANFLNIKNPLVIDADGSSWISVDTPSELNKAYKDGDTVQDDGGNDIEFDSTSMSVRSIADFAKELGYDGVIVKNVEDSDLGDQKPTTDYVSYQSNQVKSADPVTYDDAGNVIPLSQRFSLQNNDIRFSMSAPVERRKDLIAVHNMREDAIKPTAELGGFALPSIAIHKDSYGHNEFGDVTVLFGKNTIDPKKNSLNVVYSHDAWTATFPTVFNKLDVDAIETKNEKLLAILDPQVAHALRQYSLLSQSHIQDDWERVNNAGEAYGRNDALKAVYLVSKGEKVEPVYANQSFLDDAYMRIQMIGEDGLLKVYKSDIGRQLIDIYLDHDDKHADAYEKIAPRVAELLRDIIWEKDFKSSEDVKKAGYTKDKLVGDYFSGDKKLKFNELYSLSESLASLEETIDKGLYGKQVVDEWATRSAISKRVKDNDPDFVAWLNKQYDNPILGKGIYNGKERFTRSGYPRAWEVLHDPLTLGNVIKAMRKTQQEHGNVLFGSDPFGVGVKRFRSIQDVIDNANILKELTPKEEKEIKDALRVHLAQIVGRYAKTQIHPDENPFTAADRAASMMLDAFLKHGHSTSGLKRELNGWGYSANDQLVKDFFAAMTAIEVMPTNYFEAKPQRAVRFDEVKAWIVPDTISNDNRKILDDNGQRVYTYKSGDNTDRLRAVNKAADETNVRFSVVPSPTLREDIEAALRKRTNDNPNAIQKGRHDEIVFSDNIPIFEFLSLPNARVVAEVAKIRKFAIKHHLSVDQIVSIPNGYDNPVAVMRDGDGFVLLTDHQITTDDGEQKPMRLFLRPTKWRSGEIVLVATAMAENGKDELEYYEPRIKAGLMFVNENRIARLNLGEETESILRIQASGDNVKTAEDYSNWKSTPSIVAQSNAESQGARFSISGLYTGSAADYANRVPVLDKDGKVTGYRIDNKPSLLKIGTGGKQQLYGWGLYSSESREIAETYANLERIIDNRPIFVNGEAKQLDSSSINVDEAIAKAWSYVRGQDGSKDKAIAKMKESAERYGYDSQNLDRDTKILQDAIKYLETTTDVFKVEPFNHHEHIYEQTFFTNRAKGDESHLLNWREMDNLKPGNSLHEQLKWIRRQAKKEGVKLPDDLGTYGGDVYETLSSVLGSPKAASEFLVRADIDGIKYQVNNFGMPIWRASPFARNDDKVVTNYVSFRDDNIRVDHKWVDGKQRFSISASINALSDIANGKEYGILHNDKYGEIRYPLGRMGKGGFGLLHIVEQRMTKDGATLDEAINTAIRVGVSAQIGTETEQRHNTHHLDYRGTRAIIGEMPDKTIIITGYEIDTEESTGAKQRAAELSPRPHVRSEEVIRALKDKLASTPRSITNAGESNKGVDGKQRFSISASINPDIKVDVVDGRIEPAFNNLTTGEIRNYLRDRYQGREVTIRSDGTVVEFIFDGLTSTLKKRNKHRRALHRLDKLVENSHFTRYEKNDGQKKHKHLNGQFIYTAALRLNDGIYGVELKLDDPIVTNKAQFKGQTLKTKIADAVLSVGPRSKDPLPTSDYETSAAETVRLGDIVSTPRSITNAGESNKGDKKHLRFSAAAPLTVASAFPRLDKLSDTQLISAAIASKTVFGKSGKAKNRYANVNQIQRYLKAQQPGISNLELAQKTQDVLHAVREISARMKEDLDRGVSQSQILQYLPDRMRDVFASEMTAEAAKGANIGSYHERASRMLEDKATKVLNDAVAVQSGVETALLENAYGIDFSQTLMDLAENPYLKKDGQGNFLPLPGVGSGFDAEGLPPTTAKDEREVSQAIKKAVDEIAQKSAEQLKEEGESKKTSRLESNNDDDSAGLGSLSEADIAAIATRRAGVDLQNPRQLALFIAELARRWWVEKNELDQNAEAFRDRVALQFLRKTAANIYNKLVREITYSQSRDSATQAINGFEHIPTLQGLLSEMTFVGQLINARRIRETQQQMCEKLDQLLREKFGATGHFKADREELRRKVSAEMELRARYMRHAMWLTPNAAGEEAQRLRDELDMAAANFEAEDHDANQSKTFTENLRKLNILREFGALRYKPLATIESALNYWDNALEGETDAIVRANYERDIRTKMAAELLARAFHNPKQKNAYQNRGSLALSINEYIQGHMSITHLLRDMMRFASEADAAGAEKIVKWLELEIQKAGTRASAEKRQHTNAFAAAIQQIYGRHFEKVIADFTKEDERFAPFMGAKDGIKIKPTKGRAIQLMVSLLQVGHQVEVQNPDNPKETILQWVGGYHDNIVKHHREGQAQQISALLSPADLNLVKWLGQWYEMNRQDLSDVCQNLFGIGVYAETWNYFPVKMLLDKQGLEKGEAVGWSVFPKALSPRVRNERDFDTEADILQMFMSRMEEAAQWKAHAKLGLELRGIFGRTELQNAVIASHGTKANSLMLGFITDTLSGHGTYDRSPAGVDNFGDKIRGWAAIGALGGNVGVMFKQTTSIPAFGFEIGLTTTARHMMTAFTPAGFAAMNKIWNSEERKIRWDVGNSEAVKNALATNDKNWFMRIIKSSMITNKIGDCVPGLVIGQGIYRDAIDRGMSEEDAMSYTWMLIERTQQSSRIENQPSFMRRSKFGRMLYQFLSTQGQYLQYEARAIRKVIANPSLLNADGRKRWKELGRAAILNHFILSSAYFWMGQLYKSWLGQEPSDDELADWMISCLLGPYGALYCAGFTTAEALNRWIKGKSYANSNPVPSLNWVSNIIVHDPCDIIDAIMDDSKTYDDVQRKMWDWLADFNATARDLRKIYRWRIMKKPQ